MCYQRRSLTSNEQKKANSAPNDAKARDDKREELVSGLLLRQAEQAGQSTKADSGKDFTSAK